MDEEIIPNSHNASNPTNHLRWGKPPSPASLDISAFGFVPNGNLRKYGFASSSFFSEVCRNQNDMHRRGDSRIARAYCATHHKPVGTGVPDGPYDLTTLSTQTLRREKELAKPNFRKLPKDTRRSRISLRHSPTSLRMTRGVCGGSKPPPYGTPSTAPRSPFLGEEGYHANLT